MPTTRCASSATSYSAVRARDNAKLRGLWKPVLDKYRVDVEIKVNGRVLFPAGRAG